MLFTLCFLFILNILDNNYNIIFYVDSYNQQHRKHFDYFILLILLLCLNGISNGEEKRLSEDSEAYM